MARATTGAREGRYYWEAKILSGIRADPVDGDSRGHVRLGFARREAQLDGPVGFDAYSYGLRDVSGQKVHMSRPKDFANGDFVEGDVIGFEICLPSLSLHRKVAESTYNKAVDVSDDLDPMAAHEYLDIIRDRVPIRFKNTLYFGKPFSCMTIVHCLICHQLARLRSFYALFSPLMSSRAHPKAFIHSSKSRC